jgi:hypothetical protein
MSSAGSGGALRQDRRGTLQSQVLQTYSELPHKNLQVSGYVDKFPEGYKTFDMSVGNPYKHGKDMGVTEGVSDVRNLFMCS